ncbi:DUF3168 domain-containing protein [Cochlodiniinecator piscidefendens]|uniref:DUF3168 domain-containing protein n=1 Tax=Cochlodiniinecator piscidefendens TaxID=2715756 RepID=UPI0014090CFF|nr:DUF3168 domain-containing protein [Cochlodiniinecator piscidefendens]
MSYGVGASLQTAIYTHLVADTALSALVGSAIYETVPPGTLPSLYVSLGAEDVRDRSDVTASGALHSIVVSVVAETASFQAAKTAAAAVSDALVDADLSLARGQLVYSRFYKARARRIDPGDSRRIDLIFHMRVDDV